MRAEYSVERYRELYVEHQIEQSEQPQPDTNVTEDAE
jgi:hypothetical protein